MKRIVIFNGLTFKFWINNEQKKKFVDSIEISSYKKEKNFINSSHCTRLLNFLDIYDIVFASKKVKYLGKKRISLGEINVCSNEGVTYGI